MRIAVFGSRGALGEAVAYAAAHDHLVFEFPHTVCDISDAQMVARAFETPFDVAINCAGTIPLTGPTNIEYIRTNAIGPHLLADQARRTGRLLIHVSTDCVFSGQRGEPFGYNYSDLSDATDMYGRSKALGEPDGTLVVRTSFVTPRHGLWRWLLNQAAGAEVEGWTGAWWSGSTVDTVAAGLVGLAVDPPKRIGIHHLATLTPISKADVLRTMVEILGLDRTVKPVREPYINRRLYGSLPGRHLTSFDEALLEWSTWHRSE